MAIMIPTVPFDNDVRSRENDIFNALKSLSDDYFVFHSLKVSKVKNRTWYEKEIDFVIYNRNMGLMAVEAKAGKVSFDGISWHYGDSKDMRDPFRQAEGGKWELKNLLDKRRPNGLYGLSSRCKCVCAVWFVSLTGEELESMMMPTNAPKEIVFTADDLDNPTRTVERIFSYSNSRVNEIITRLTDADHSFIINNVLCPKFEIIPSKTLEIDARRRKFDAMLKEQTGLLNYLEYQRTAVINGFAGTGKTMIALEKARRHSEAGDSVLFLCFNNKLKNYLEKNYDYENVSYYTIDGFACAFCQRSTVDFPLLEEKLMDELDGLSDNFGYTHVIIDEGQDFGQDRIDADILFNLFRELVMRTERGSFYIFYDKLQLIQSGKVPRYIDQADCRLTLYTNCRNTKNIASTSMRPLVLKNKEPMLDVRALVGRQPEIYYCDTESARDELDKIISQSLENGIDNIQIVSCAPAKGGLFSEYMEAEKYPFRNKHINITTVRKFKGLEAEHVILVDVDKNVLESGSNLFYVGASRAQLFLSILANISTRECREVLAKFNNKVKKNDPEWSLAKYLDCKYSSYK